MDFTHQMKCWNWLAKKFKLREISELTEARKLKLVQRLQERPRLWREIYSELQQAQEFLLKAPWFDFDWILNPENLAKLLEGKYRQVKEEETGPGYTRSAQETLRRIREAEASAEPYEGLLERFRARRKEMAKEA